MSATFKCNVSGNLVTFKDAVDIESMRIHPEYTEVVEEVKQEQTTTEEAPKQSFRGRPRKEQ